MMFCMGIGNMEEKMIGIENVSVLVDWQLLFRDYLLGLGLSNASIEAYLQDVSGFCRWWEAENRQVFDARMVTSFDLRGYRSWCMDGRRCSPATWNRRREGLRRFCDWLMRERYLSYDPFQGVERWEEAEQAPRWLDGNEFGRLMRQVEIGVNGARSEAWRRQAVRDWGMISLMVFAGLREGEVVALRVEDVVINERSGKVVVWSGKGDKKREVPLGREVRQALREWLAVRGNGGEFLFDGKGTQRVSVRLVQRRVAEYGRLAGIEKLTPHMLRHTFAKRLLDKGTPITVVSRLLGHKRLETTARYVTPGWGDLEQAVELV